jgi:predicted short-subunit dehydrogenase-like oxidoreductase (DUF2520 family)
VPVKRKYRLPTIALVGSGNLAQAIAPALLSAGYRFATVAFRGNADSLRRARLLARRLRAKAIAIEEITPADITWLCHTDDVLGETARLLAKRCEWKGKIVFHSSGALSSDVLAPLRKAGADVASVHPLMTFVPRVRPQFTGVPLTVEGDRQAVAAASRIAKRLGAEFFAISKKSKVLYHALGSFSSPLLVATLASAERVGIAAGLSRQQTRTMIAPIVQQTLKNYLERSAPAAFSGPIKRGDINTVRRHLRELRRVPEAREVYRALVLSALRELPAKNIRQLGTLLGKS